MLIIRDKKAYVQRSDLLYIFNSGVDIPEEIVYGLITECYDNVYFVDNTNKYEFVDFDDPRIIEFLKSIPFIVNFDEYSVLTEEPLIVKIEEIINKKNAITKKYNSMSVEERVDNAYLAQEIKNLDFLTNSAVDFLNYQIGILDFSLPDGITSPGRSVSQRTRFSIIDKIKGMFNRNKNK